MDRERDMAGTGQWQERDRGGTGKEQDRYSTGAEQGKDRDRAGDACKTARERPVLSPPTPTPALRAQSINLLLFRSRTPTILLDSAEWRPLDFRFPLTITELFNDALF
jgi:hypothetical protein